MKMRQIGLALLVLTVPAGALAQDVYIRLEARRGPDAVMAAVEQYAAEADDVVTYPSGATWTAIALGPIEGGKDAAQDRLADLKRRSIAPADAFVTTIEDSARISDLATLRGRAAGADADDGTAATDPAPEADIGAADAETAGDDATAPAPAAHIRIEARPDRASADAALAHWREVLPGAALWRLTDGWLAVAIGPVDPEAAPAWLSDWKAAGALPHDAFITTEDRLGEALTTGAPPDLTAPPESFAMPPVEVMQEALRWAGRYDGAADGKLGPQTMAALAAEMAAQGIDPMSHDAEARTMQALLARREGWHDAMGLAQLEDDFTGLRLTAPMTHLEFLRVEHDLSIYGPKDESGAALILFDRPGGQQDMTDLAGFITALGWVPHPQREMAAGSFRLDGENDTHIGHAEGRIENGRIRGFVLIWPQGDAENAPRLAALAAETLTAGNAD